jgi:hypothetical protein
MMGGGMVGGMGGMRGRGAGGEGDQPHAPLPNPLPASVARE